ncbi:MAG TPA: hypothetical protein VIM30_14480 [Candidatus Limnocylindrales bacterium]
MPAQRIAENLAYINWTVLVSLAVGSFAAVIFGRLHTSATRGYLGFTAFCALVFGLLAFASDGALPGTLGGSPVVGNATWDGPRHVAIGLLCLLSLGYLIAIARGRRAPLIELAGTLASGAVLALAAFSWGEGPVGTALLLIQFALLATATGGVFAAMILGHWYLVTPKLPERPLVLFARILNVALAVQLVLFVVWVAAGAGPGGAAGFAALAGPFALFVWLRLIVGLIFPLIVSWMAVQTARTRSMESATGLLYINVGTIAAGTILAAGLYFGAGLLV